MAATDEDRPRTGDRRTTSLTILLVFVGLFITGALIPGFDLGLWNPDYYAAHPLAVPPTFYLYAYVGTMGSVVLAVAEGVDPGTELAGVLLRVPAALFLATGIFLLGGLLDLGPLIGGTRGVEELALMAYVTGLFANRAFGALQVLSERLYPGPPAELEGGRPRRPARSE